MPKQQLEVAGVIKRIPAIEDAAATYVKIRDRRMQYTVQEVEARAALIVAMKAAKLDTYTTVEELVCLLSSTEKVKVKALKDGEDEDE